MQKERRRESPLTIRNPNCACIVVAHGRTPNCVSWSVDKLTLNGTGCIGFRSSRCWIEPDSRCGWSIHGRLSGPTVARPMSWIVNGIGNLRVWDC